MSALTGEGLQGLERAIIEGIGGRAGGGGDLVITRARHHGALKRAAMSLVTGAEALAQGAPFELVAVDVAEATEAIGGAASKAADAVPGRDA